MLLRITYEIITEESAQDGDAAERGWIDEEGEEFTVDALAVGLAHLEASSSEYYNGIWYSDADGDKNYCTGDTTFLRYHATGTEAEQRALYEAITGKKA